MTLGEFIKDKKGEICALYFEKMQLKSYTINDKNRNNIPEEILNMEYMEDNVDDGVTEVWVK